MPASYLTRTFITLSLMLISQFAIADVKLPSVDDAFVSLKLEDSKRDAGYVVGDVISRKITLTIKKPYQLIKESIPIVGYEHRYKGQVSGIELVNINLSSKESSDSEIHKLDLSYQIFTTSRVAKPAVLRAEIIKLRNIENKKEVLQYRIPSFSFRISPLSVYGAVKLDQEMYPFTPPLTIDSSKQHFNVKLLISILALSLLGLLYILGKHAWLPRMGKPFSKAYRYIKKLPETQTGLQQAVSRMHESLNKTAGVSVFSHTLDQFIENNPRFEPAKYEIQKFFNLSQEVFFEPVSKSHVGNDPSGWLLKFCRHLRDCERGLMPNLDPGKST